MCIRDSTHFPGSRLRKSWRRSRLPVLTVSFSLSGGRWSSGRVGHEIGGEKPGWSRGVHLSPRFLSRGYSRDHGCKLGIDNGVRKVHRRVTFQLYHQAVYQGSQLLLLSPRSFRNRSRHTEDRSSFQRNICRVYTICANIIRDGSKGYEPDSEELHTFANNSVSQVSS